jgi:mono/diheme cytochrome c family protein
MDMLATRVGARLPAAAVVVLSALLFASCKQQPPQPNPQGWDAATRGGWYNVNQGSRLMPLTWMRALEQPGAAVGDCPSEPPLAGAAGAGDKPKLFLDPAYLAEFRILPAWSGADLPIGFSVDDSDDSSFVRTNLHWRSGIPPAQDKVRWVGLNCAACHTAQMTYNSQTYTVDGAPSLFDFQCFVENVDAALGQTRDDAKSGAAGGRWDRFAKSVLGQNDDNPGNRAGLLAALGKLIDWEGQTEALNHTDLRYGYGRVDAVGHIFNRILLFGGAPQPSPNAADAPVSYPHLWNITKETQVQWDGIAQNAKLNIGAIPTDFGALGRNAGEVLGVFGEVVIKPPSSMADLSGFNSSINTGNLNSIEVALTRLTPPSWPAAFGAPGQLTATDPSTGQLSSTQVLQAGKALFDSNCAACHTPQAHYETMKTFADLGPDNLTDEWMACNAFLYTGASGALTGIPINYVNGDKVAASSPVRILLETSVKGALVGQKRAFVEAAAQNIFGITPIPPTPRLALRVPLSPKQQRLNRCMQNASDPLMAYKARPLEGIWATAPYLHNGSVPTLYDLLLPPAQRPKTFALGTRAFDPRKVGYDTNPAAVGNTFTFDTSLPGNSNKGHVYGVGALTEIQRQELLEYLKTL